MSKSSDRTTLQRDSTRGRRVEVSVEPFKARVLELVERGFTLSEIGEWCGYPYRDGSRIQRTVGLRPESAGRGRVYPCKTHISYGLACRLARGLDLDPVDVGI